GGNQRVAGRPAGHLAQQSDLPQGEPVGRADHHPGADFADTLAGADLRVGVQPRAAEARAGRRRRRCRARRRLAACGAGRAAAVFAEPLRRQHGRRARLPELQAQLPPDVTIRVASDSTNSIRASLREIEGTLVIAIILVVLVVGAFLRSARATVIPAAATIVSLLGTFGVMVLLGFSLNNLSLMALTVATGFVVDDAIVVLENTSRHIEQGMDRFKAALLGTREVGFTVLSISLSLVGVFLPILLMGGIIGRL